MMAARPEGIESERFYSDKEEWTVLDLPDLSVKQQEKIAKHQIEDLVSCFFNWFHEFQKS